MNWIKTSDQLPPFGKRVLCWIPETHLFGHGLNDPHNTFLYSREKINNYEDLGNNEVPYYWRCENSGSAFGQEVSHWAYIDGPESDTTEEQLPETFGEVERNAQFKKFDDFFAHPAGIMPKRG